MFILTLVQSHTHRHCSDCFRQLGHLKRHLLKSHNEGTWFTCNICQKKFSCSSILKTHILRHEGVKPYVCDECSMSFCRACDLKKNISLNTQTLDSFAVVLVANITNANNLL